MITFCCKYCGQKISVADIHAGKKGQCSKCKNLLEVPAVQETVQPAAAEKVNATGYSKPEFSFQDGPDKNKENQDAGSSPPTDYYQTKIVAEEPPPKRKFPWLIDIFFYPLSIPGIITLAIIILVPFIINIVVGMLGPFGFFVGFAGAVVRIILWFYFYWYFCQCVRDSASGGIRAPEVLDAAPDIGEIFFQFLKILVCIIFFAAPMLIYLIHTKRTDIYFWALLGYAVLFFPMGLLAVIMFDSLTGLNPLLVIGSIFSTFLPYFGLVLFYYILAASDVFTTIMFFKGILPWSYLLIFLLGSVNTYLFIISGHLLGRFFWRYRERLNWDV